MFCAKPKRIQFNTQSLRKRERRFLHRVCLIFECLEILHRIVYFCSLSSAYSTTQPSRRATISLPSSMSPGFLTIRLYGFCQPARSSTALCCCWDDVFLILIVLSYCKGNFLIILAFLIHTFL